MTTQNQPPKTEYTQNLLVEIVAPDGTKTIEELTDPRIEYCRSYNGLLGRLGYVARPINPPSSQSL